MASKNSTDSKATKQSDGRTHTVKVSDPQTHSGWMGMKNFITYRVVVTILDESESSCSSVRSFDVRRRYSDFEWVRSRMTNRFRGMWITALPPKHGVGAMGNVGAQNVGGAFIMARMDGLRSFLTRALDSPYLRDDKSLLRFLSQRDANAWSKSKKEAMPPPPSTSLLQASASTDGVADWLRVVASHRLPEQPSQKLTKIQAHTAQLLASQDVLCKKVYIMAGAMRSCSSGVRKLKETLQENATDLEAFAECLGRPSDEDAAPCASKRNDMPHSKLMEKTATTLEVWQHSVANQASQAQNLLLRPMNDAVLQSGGMLELLKEHDCTLARHAAAWKAKDRCAFDIKKAEETGKAEKVPKLKINLEQLTQKSDASAELMNHESRALLRTELPRYSLWQLESSRIAFGQYAALQVKNCEQEEEAYAALLKDLGVDPKEVLDQAHRSLAGTLDMSTAVLPPYSTDTLDQKVGHKASEEGDDSSSPFPELAVPRTMPAESLSQPSSPAPPLPPTPLAATAPPLPPHMPVVVTAPVAAPIAIAAGSPPSTAGSLPQRTTGSSPPRPPRRIASPRHPSGGLNRTAAMPPLKLTPETTVAAAITYPALDDDETVAAAVPIPVSPGFSPIKSRLESDSEQNDSGMFLCGEEDLVLSDDGDDEGIFI